MRILMEKKDIKKKSVRSLWKIALIMGALTIVGIGIGIILAPGSTKASIDLVAQDMSDVIVKAKDINHDLKDGCHHIRHHMHKTAKKISKRIKKTK